MEKETNDNEMAADRTLDVVGKIVGSKIGSKFLITHDAITCGDFVYSIYTGDIDLCVAAFGDGDLCIEFIGMKEPNRTILNKRHFLRAILQ